jgi:hypothetical protein
MAKANEVSVAAIQKALEGNPDLLRAALSKMAPAQQGKQAYSVIGTEEKDVPLFKMENTRIVPDGVRKVKHYQIRCMNGSIVSIPEHCLKDYNISLERIPIVDDDGLTEADRRMAIEQGAC